MAITTIDGIISAISSGNTWHWTYQKQLASSNPYTAGRWYDMAPLAGMPPAETFPGSSGTATAFIPTSGTNPGWMPIGGTGGYAVSPSVRSLVAAEAVTSSSSGLGWLVLVDMLLYYPTVSLTATTASLTNTVTLSNMPYPRYTSGAGVMAYFAVTSGTESSTPTIYLTYTNSGGTGSRTTLSTMTAVGAGTVPEIVYAAPAANNFGPFFPLQAGDLGIQSVQSVTLSGTTGATNGVLVLCRPLVQIPITTQYVPTGRDFVFNMPTMPVIYDGAYLNYLYFPSAATVVSSTFVGTFDYVWG